MRCSLPVDAIATASGRLEDLVPLGAVLADLELFAEADAVYRKAFSAYDDVSPFPLAWVCFQLGMLWGELVPVPDANLAALWYRRAIAYLPGYVKARVHLAEIAANQDQTGEAEALLMPALSSRDPEVRWRLADVLIAQGRFEEGERQLDAATVWLRSSFLRDICSPLRTMPRSSMPAAVTIAGGRSRSRARMSPIVPPAVRSSRRMRSRCWLMKPQPQAICTKCAKRSARMTIAMPPWSSTFPDDSNLATRTRSDQVVR